ncbi:MAG: serine hydrolase domain-containing protein [Bryobacteraceae bacterium]
MKQTITNIAIAVLLAAPALTAQPSARIGALLKKWSIPAASITILQHGKPVFSEGFGTKPESLFRIASVSKPITAAAVLLLFEQGKLKLDDPILDYLPQYRNGITDIRLRNVTVRHLLQHSGGWDERASGDPVFATYEALIENGLSLPPDRDEIIAGWLTLPLDFEPGTKFAYSNFGYVLLGRIIEHVSGQAYAKFVATHVLGNCARQAGTVREDRAEDEVEYFDTPGAPLSLSVFSLQPQSVARPYGAFSIAVQDSAAGWLASSPDLARFLWRLTQGKILKKQTLEEMLRRPSFYPADSQAWYGLGINVVQTPDGPALEHTGAFPGTVAEIVHLANGFTYAALFNSMPANYLAFITELQTILLELDE